MDRKDSYNNIRMEQTTWVYQVLFSVLCFVVAMLFLVKAQNNKKKNKEVVGLLGNIMMVFISTILSIIFLIWSTKYRTHFIELFENKDYRINVLPLIIVFGILFFIGNMFFFTGLINAPNPGLARALMTTELALITVLSYFLFDQSINYIQFIGIILVTIGAILVSL